LQALVWIAFTSPLGRAVRTRSGRHQGNPLLGRMDRRRLGPTARGSVPRLQAASLVGTSCSRAEPPPGMATRLPGRSPGFLPLRRLRGPVDRDHACRQPRTANRQRTAGASRKFSWPAIARPGWARRSASPSAPLASSAPSTCGSARPIKISPDPRPPPDPS